ncbi:GNAT family N-acetyltransferase [Bacillus songklensis]|uniref:GNAT family N-acetyltransferase n=1 Tax=Bacillus songklensis TaxID=1069116 RepID=A0ABV8BA41_9BACI
MIKLRYFEKEDFDKMILWSPAEEFLVQWSGNTFTYPLTVEQLEAYLNKSNVEGAEQFVFSVLDAETDEMIGHISLAKIDYKNRSGRIGRVLIGNEKYRNKGIGKQMMKEILSFGFDKLNLHRMTLGVYDFNERAIRTYEQIGLVREGLLREVQKVKNQYWNCIEMSMLEHEWKQR